MSLNPASPDVGQDVASDDIQGPERMAQVLADHFVNDHQRYALHTCAGGCRAFEASLGQKDLLTHVRGRKTVMTACRAAAGTTKWLCLVVQDDAVTTDDTVLRLAIQVLSTQMTHFSLPFLVEAAGARQYRLWVLLESPVIVTLVDYAGRNLLASIDEVLPASVRVAVRPPSIAPARDFIRLPWGVHRVTGERTHFCDAVLGIADADEASGISSQLTRVEGLARVSSQQLKELNDELL